jgi:hypothetical protein
MLFDEALFEHPELRKIARAAIAIEVTWGGDVESPAFAARHGIPTYGCVGLHVCGWQQRLIVPPYEDQARRLFVRFDKIRGRIDQDDPRWADAQAEGQIRFFQTGELPADEVHRDAVLATTEEGALQRHKRGEDVTALMAALDTAARGSGERRDAAIATVQDLVRARAKLP